MGGVPKKVLVKLQSSFPSMFQFPVLPQPAGLGAAPEMKVLQSPCSGRGSGRRS